jgi:hypothetical protein
LGIVRSGHAPHTDDGLRAALVGNCGEVCVRAVPPTRMVVSELCSYVTIGHRTIVSQLLWTVICTLVKAHLCLFCCHVISQGVRVQVG